MRTLSLLIVTALLAGCGMTQTSTQEERLAQRDADVRREFDMSEESFFDLFRDPGNPEQGVVVNRYLWQASLDILSFLPLETADPFSGIITTAWGNVAGTGAYRVTVYISEPALDARSLKVAAFPRRREQRHAGHRGAEPRDRGRDPDAGRASSASPPPAASPDKARTCRISISWCPARPRSSRAHAHVPL
jgi:hypothetical protein